MENNVFPQSIGRTVNNDNIQEWLQAVRQLTTWIWEEQLRYLK